VGFLVSYFLAEEVELLATFDRETGETRIAHTLASVPGERRLDVPLFIVTSPWTGSAAEAFAYTLQQVGRATVVGTASAGAAQGGGWVPVDEGFLVFIPTFRPFNPETGDSWEGKGVQPDVPAPVERARDVAHLRAVRALESQASTNELRWLLPLLELNAEGPAKCDPSGIAGRYQGIEITAVDGELRFLGASGILRELTPLSDGTFLVDDSSVPMSAQARVRFLRSAGTCTGLELLTEDGEVLPRARL
jgi:peptidase S41-like protein